MEKKCEYCGELFIAKKKHRRHCSNSCRQMAFVRRNKTVNNDLSGKQQASTDLLPETLNTSLSGSETVNIEQKTSIDSSESKDKTSTGNPKIVNTTVKTSIQELTKKEKASIDATENVNNNRESSIETVNLEVKSSIVNDKNANFEMETSLENVNYQAKSSIPLFENVNKNNTKPVNAVIKPGEIPVESGFVRELMGLYEERDRLQSTFYQLIFKDSAAKWVSLRFKCILECLLTFSEMKTIETDDLKEVCNSLISICRSSYFKQLPVKYPYTEDIMELKESLKAICLGLIDPTPIRFRLKREVKINLIVFRCEMAPVIPKRSFKQLKI